MTGRIIAPIVEGHGEVYAIPGLLRRVCGEFFGRYDVTVRKPWRSPRGKISKVSELSGIVEALLREANTGAVVIFDQDDDDCVVEVARDLQAGFASTDLQVVLACREFEAWFLAGIESLRTHRSVLDSAQFSSDPEAPRDAKGKLSRQMRESYKETLHQPAFVDIVNLEDIRLRSRSFRRLVSATGSLIGECTTKQST